MADIISRLFESSLFGIALSVGTYWIGTLIKNKFKSPVLNPLLIATILTILILVVFKIPFESYKKGGDIITLFLTPATAVLAYSIYKQFEMLKKYWLPVIVGACVGAGTAVASVLLLTRLFNLNELLTASLVPKSVTTAIAMELSTMLGGNSSITVICVVITGVFGAAFAPTLAKLFRIKNKVALGVAIGASSHAGGTSRAIEIGETEGAMSGIAIGITGLATVLITLFL